MNQDPDILRDALVAAALAVRQNSHSPYSKFAVGAALRTRSGRIFVGTNVECSSYGLTVCAERAAVCAAVAAGEPNLVEIAVVADCPAPVPPCGACRQILHDFGPDAGVILVNLQGQHHTCRVSDLLPLAFTPALLPGA